mgnify:CR=1 FL=1
MEKLQDTINSKRFKHIMHAVLAMLMIGWVVKPVEETLVFQNGKAVNSEGETVPIILPSLVTEIQS